jgi:hypothetical protein
MADASCVRGARTRAERGVLRGATLVALGLVALAARSGDVCAEPTPGPVAPARAAPTQSPAQADARTGSRLAVLVGKPGERTSALHVIARAAGGPLALGPAVATLTHGPFATYKAAALGPDVLVVLDEAERGDRSFGSALIVLRPGVAPRRLVGEIAHASRPVPVPGTAEVVVARGVIAKDAGGARADRLTLDAVDVRTGKLRTLYRATGSALYVAGIHAGEVVFDRIDATGDGALVAVRLDTLATRVIAPRLSPFARDFAIDDAGHAVVFADRHESDRSRFVVDRIDLATGARDRLHEDESSTLAPQIWPDGSLALTRDPQKPLERFDLGRGVRAARARGLPRGVGRVNAVEPGKAVAVTTSEAGALPIVSVVDPLTGKSATLAVPAGHRATVAGFLPRGTR